MQAPDRERVIKHIELCTRFVSSKFEFSISGHLNNIRRGGIVDYQRPDDIIYTSIHMAIARDDYITAFELMLKNKMADCFEQSLLLALTLKDQTEIVKDYCITIVNVESETSHTFLVILPRDPSPRELIGDGKPGVPLSGRQLLEHSQLIIADPWRGSIQLGGLSGTANPLNYSDVFGDFATVDFFLSNLDLCWIDIQSKFKSRTFDRAAAPCLNEYFDQIARLAIPIATSLALDDALEVAVTDRTFVAGGGGSFTEPSESKSRTSSGEAMFGVHAISSPLKDILTSGERGDASRHTLFELRSMGVRI